MDAPSAQFDRYVILAPLGAGGMGEVVKARALGPHGFEKIVAIKRIRAEWAEQEAMAERFIREARIAARLQHANIVHVFDFGRHGGELFIVMEYVEGQSLDTVLQALRANGERPTLAQTLQVALDVSRALDCAHNLTDEDGAASGVIHRDVSPANILVSRQGVVKLTDFGIAAVSSQQGRTSLIAGKPLYMAPEQLRGEPLDARADLFAAGIVVYEMLTGERPWQGLVDASPGATLDSMGYRPPSARTADVPEAVDALVARLLAPAVGERLSSARELTKEILSISYRCQIVLDPGELRGLVADPISAAHAPTLPQYASRPQTWVATGVSPEGVTMLRTADEAAKPSRGVPTWIWAALALLVVAGGAFAARPLFRADAAANDPLVVAEPRRPAPIEAAPGAAARQVEPERPEPQPAEPVPPDPEPTEPAPIELARPEQTVARGTPQRSPPRRERPSRTEPAREPERVEGEGELDVFSRPWAEIYVDGRRLSQNAPARGLRVPAGRRVVRLVNPVLGLSAERTVNVPAGGRASVRVFLDQGGAAPE